MRMLRPCLVMFALMLLLLGVIYPAVVYGVGTLLFPDKAQGRLIYKNDKLVGLAMVGQRFINRAYFHTRHTGPSNLNAADPVLLARLEHRAINLRTENPDVQTPVPAELAMGSASGLDPHISPAAALWQALRVAKARGIDVQTVTQLIDAHTEPRNLFLGGAARVNVLLLNMALDNKEQKQ